MKNNIILFLSFGLFIPLSASQAQDPGAGGGYAEVQQVRLSPEQLDELVAPIALYPDPLVALILPASTVPTDVVLANRYVKDGKDVNQIDSQNWDPSVKSLARYPDILNTMDENLDWTNQLGAAVIAQQADVMQSIQNQRAKANALGNLNTTAQQQVVVEQQVIQIVPADPQVIYVPVYDPQMVYVERAPEYSPFISFGIGFAMGAWLTNDCDWNNRGFYVNNWGRNGWHGYPRYNNVNVNINRNNAYWSPNLHRPPPRPPYVPNRPNAVASQNLPAFRQVPEGTVNGINRARAGQNNRPAGVSPAQVNSQARSAQPDSVVAPNLTQSGRPGSGGNNGQAPRENGKKDRSTNSPVFPPIQSNQATPQAVVTPQNRTEKTAPQPGVTPQVKQHKNQPQEASDPQTQHPRATQNPAVAPQIQQKAPTPQATPNFQKRQQAPAPQSAPAPQFQQQKNSPQSSPSRSQPQAQQRQAQPKAKDRPQAQQPPAQQAPAQDPGDGGQGRQRRQ